MPGETRGWSSIHVSDGDHPYTGNWWVPGLCLGYEHSFVHGAVEFMKSLDAPSAKKAYPDFRNALGTQYVCDAVLESAKPDSGLTSEGVILQRIYSKKTGSFLSVFFYVR